MAPTNIQSGYNEADKRGSEEGRHFSVAMVEGVDFALSCAMQERRQTVGVMLHHASMKVPGWLRLHSIPRYTICPQMPHAMQA